MHFHVPKPLHGWREFAGEVGIIVIGVLIALGAESVIEDLRWQHQVSTAEDQLKSELGRVAGLSYERLILQPCISTRLSQLGDELRASKGKWKGSPMILNGPNKRALLAAYRTPNRPFVVDAWQNAETSGTLNHMPKERVLTMAAVYGQARQFYELQEEEAQASARIAPLAYDEDLTPDTRISMLAALADIDRINTLMSIMADQMVEKIRSLQLGFVPSKIEEGRHELLSQTRESFGQCVADVPLRV